MLTNYDYFSYRITSGVVQVSAISKSVRTCLTLGHKHCYHCHLLLQEFVVFTLKIKSKWTILAIGEKYRPDLEDGGGGRVVVCRPRYLAVRLF